MTNARSTLALLGVLLAGTAHAQQAPSTAAAPGLLFHVSGDAGATADRAAGTAGPIFAQGVSRISDGAIGGALRMNSRLSLAWSAPGNIYAQRGALAFFVRQPAAFDTAPFTLFRVGAADSTSWDMTFLRIDWTGHGFDAFVTDTNLARVRVSWTAPVAPAAGRWLHVAFAWDENRGVVLWIDGKRVAAKLQRADLDQALFGFGPFQRVVSPHKVESTYNYQHAGDLDELRIYDIALDDDAVAALAKGAPAPAPAAPIRGLADPTVAAEWRDRYGWGGASGAVDYAAGDVIAVRRVEFTDTRDGQEKAFRGADGIRETTWPGVYNRSRLAGRRDYFVLPDWNVYATGGETYRLTLPDEAWNHIEIIGAAHGQLARLDGGREQLLLTRPAGILRTATQLAGEQRGGTLVFHNAVQETPIQEIGAYRITARDTLPQGFARLDYRVDPAAAPAAYASLADPIARITGRFPIDERATVVALPAGAPSTPRPAAAGGLPVVHVLIPATFRDQPPGGAARRFSYGWENLDGGLDGVALRLPVLHLAPERDGLVPLNIRLHDPLWPDRDLIDVVVRVRPGARQTVWLDSRDRVLRGDLPLSLTIASPSNAFGAGTLAGMGVSLLFKPRAAALAEHVADRLEQARDGLAFLVEEQPSTRLFPVWTRFERDVSDVLAVDPGNAKARALWVEKNPEQPYGAPLALPQVAGVPDWALRQTESLTLYRRFVDWWIDHRQAPDGELGGGLSDDTDLVNQWVPLALMGVEPDRLRASQRAVLEATHANGMWTGGIATLQTDQLHSYEEGINTLAQAMMLDWGNPTLLERAMAEARAYPRLIERNAAGHAHFVSGWFSGAAIERGGGLDVQLPYSFLITHPGLLLVDYNGAPAARAPILAALDGWLAHGRETPEGWRFPEEIRWGSDAASGNGVSSAVHDFWAAWRWTGDARYLRPIMPAGMSKGSLASLFALNADALAILPGGAALAQRIAAGGAGEGGGRVDPNLGTVGEAQRARFVRWQQGGDNAILAGLYADDVRAITPRMYVLTEAELWTDRVAVPSELLQRARMGGVAHLRNSYYPGNLVSWRFDDPDVAEKVGLLLPDGDPRHFRVVAFNMAGRPVVATMLGAMLAPGRWSVRYGVDRNGDNRGDAPVALPAVLLERGRGTTLTLPPGQAVVYEFTLDTPGDDPATRPDIGLSVDDVVRRGSALAVTVHSLGAVATPAGRVTLRDAAGATRASVRFAALAAPADLHPRTQTVRLPLARGTAGTLTVEVTLDGDPSEVSAANNRVVLPTSSPAPR